jgi:hypothetical protein
MAARSAHIAAGNPGWLQAALEELTAALRDDYPRMMSFLGAAGEIDV